MGTKKAAIKYFVFGQCHSNPLLLSLKMRLVNSAAMAGHHMAAVLNKLATLPDTFKRIEVTSKTAVIKKVNARNVHIFLENNWLLLLLISVGLSFIA